MTNTINNNIPYVPENTIDPAAGLNLSLNTIDALLQCRVVSIGDNDPPSEAVDGERYIIGDTPTGEWDADAGRLAVFLDGAWDFYDAWIVLNATDNLLYINNGSGVWSRVSARVGSFAWSARPNAADLPADSLVFINDFPIAGLGSWWKAIPAFGAFAPMAGDMLLASTVDVSILDNTSEQIVGLMPPLPVGIIFGGLSRFSIDVQLAKSTGAIACTYRIRVGDTGTTSDPIVHEVTLGATARSARINSSLIFVDDTSVTACPTASGEFGESTTVWPASVTIPDVTADTTYITMSLQMASSGGTVTVKNAICNMQLA